MRRLRRFALSTIFFALWVSAISMDFHVRFVWPRSFLLFLVFYRAQRTVNPEPRLRGDRVERIVRLSPQLIDAA